VGGGGDVRAVPPEAQAVHDVLARRGASFGADIARATGLAPAAVDGALWTLVAHGLVTGDGVAGLRLLIDPADEGLRMLGTRNRQRLLPPGRRALLPAPGQGQPPPHPQRLPRPRPPPPGGLP